MTDRTTRRLRGKKRDAVLRRAGYNSYAHYLRSPAWARTRLLYFRDRGRACYLCAGEEHIQVHHMTYERVGRENLDDLVALCSGCHAMVHTLEQRGEIGLDFAGLVNRERARIYAAEQRPIERPDPPDFSKDPLHIRLNRVRKAAKARHMDISSDLQVVKRTVSKMERKVWPHVFAVPPAHRRI